MEHWMKRMTFCVKVPVYKPGNTVKAVTKTAAAWRPICHRLSYLVGKDIVNLAQLLVKGGRARDGRGVVAFVVHLTIPANEQGLAYTDQLDAGQQAWLESVLGHGTTPKGLPLPAKHACKHALPDVEGDRNKVAEHDEVGEELQGANLRSVVRLPVKVHGELLYKGRLGKQHVFYKPGLASLRCLVTARIRQTRWPAPCT